MIKKRLFELCTSVEVVDQGFFTYKNNYDRRTI